MALPAKPCSAQPVYPRLTALALGIAIATASASATAEPSPASPRRLAIGLGFSHWFGTTFGSPDGYSTPTLWAGVRPGLRFLELRFRTSFSTSGFDYRTGRRGPASFTSLGVMVEHELHLGRQSLGIFLGPEAVAVRADGTSFGFDLALGFEFLIHTGLAPRHTVGFFVAAREMFYRLGSDTTSLFDASLRDGQIDLGVMTTLF